MDSLSLLKKFIKETLLKEKHHKNYSAPKGSKRAKQLDATKADLDSGDPEREARAFRRRERMEKNAASEKGFKNKPRSDSKK